MVTNGEVELSDAEVDAFLARHETGVLSLAREETPYAIPISYGFDEASRDAFLRLVSTPDSETRKVLGSDPRARIVVHETDGDAYTSVIGVGTLRRVDLDELTPESIAQYGETRRPRCEIWADGNADLDSALYRCVPERLTGRTVVVDRDCDGTAACGGAPRRVPPVCARSRDARELLVTRRRARGTAVDSLAFGAGVEVLVARGGRTDRTARREDRLPHLLVDLDGLCAVRAGEVDGGQHGPSLVSGRERRAI